MPLKPSQCRLIIEHEQSSAGQVWVKSAPALLVHFVPRYDVCSYPLSCYWLLNKLLWPLPGSHPESHQSVSTYDGAHVCVATSLLKTTLTSWGPFSFFFPLQHVCNSPAVPQIEAFSLIYHQSVRLSAEQHRLLRPGIKWEEEKEKGNNNVWLQKHSHMHHLILWNESLYTKTDKKQSGEVGVIGFVASDWHSDGVNWCRWNQFPLISLPLCFVEVRYSVSKQLRLQLHWHVQKV